MPLYTEIKATLIDNLNKLNGSTVQVAQIVWSTPKPTGGKWNGKDITQNTAVRITGASGAAWVGSTVILYNRIDLNDFSTMVGGVVKVASVDTIYKLLSAINAFYGLNFQQADFVDAPIAIDSNGNGNVALTPVDGSLSWVGTWNILLAKGDANLPDQLTDTDLDGLHYPVSDDTTQRLAPAMFYGLDFTTDYDKMVAIKVGDVIDASLLALINARSSYSSATGWTITGAAAANNLGGATVVSVGAATDIALANADRFQYAIELKPDTTKTTTVRGNFLLHYNKPIDNSAVE